MAARTTIPATTLSVSPVCRGTAERSAKIGSEKGRAVFDAFIEGGGNFFDIADCYAFWRSDRDSSRERALGQWAQSCGQADLVIAVLGTHSPAHLSDAMSASDPKLTPQDVVFLAAVDETQPETL